VTGPAIRDMPVSGRSEPRETPLPDAFRHNVRLYGQPGGEVRAVCTCSDGDRPWARTFEPGHTPNDFVRLEIQHVTGGAA
jgi:hypothetical protein